MLYTDYVKVYILLANVGASINIGICTYEKPIRSGRNYLITC